MARSKEFNREVVLERAMQYFWERGYEAASMRDLLKVMGIGRQSLYDTFGDKHGLFIASIKQYYAMGTKYVISKLNAPDAGLQSIESYFDQIGGQYCSQPYKSCLIINSSIELAPHDEEVAVIANQFISSLKHGFANALLGAQRNGEVKSIDVDAVAWLLTSSAIGMGPMSKARIPFEALKRAATQILDTIKT